MSAAPGDSGNASGAEGAGPVRAPIEGPSYHLLVKLVATLLVVGLVGFGIGIWHELQRLDPLGKALFGTAVLSMLAAYVAVLSSRTRIDGESIRQTWLWPKEVRLVDITELRLIHVPGLSWLILPRLVVKTGGFARHVFPVADPRVLAAFRELAFGRDEPPRDPSGDPH